jgi:hypothetical protein
MAVNIQFIRIKIGEHVIDASMDDLKTLKDILDKLFNQNTALTPWVPTTYPPRIIPWTGDETPWHPPTWVYFSTICSTWPSGQSPEAGTVVTN